MLDDGSSAHHIAVGVCADLGCWGVAAVHIELQHLLVHERLDAGDLGHLHRVVGIQIVGGTGHRVDVNRYVLEVTGIFFDDTTDLDGLALADDDGLSTHWF